FFELEAAETDALRALAKSERITLFMVLSSIFSILLSKLSGQEDIVTGSPSAGRGHGDLDNIIGMFVNTLALRNYPSGDKVFREFLKELEKRVLAAFENQDYQFEELVDRVVVNRDPGRNPLFDVVFAFENMESEGGEPHGLKLNLRRFESGTSKFDMTFFVKEVTEGL
ncbi:MAG: hypothetical protein GY950_06295, partial [bacterium]|nr:hypothetical protein [bacterium]